MGLRRSNEFSKWAGIVPNVSKANACHRCINRLNYNDIRSGVAFRVSAFSGEVNEVARLL